jgi:anti-anti-sigma factor
MTATTTVDTGHVGCARLADGMVVQLAGDLAREQLPLLRQVLLTPMPSDCRDVIVDAGAVDRIDDAALAVLVAAREWVEEQGGRFMLSRCSDALDEALCEMGFAEGLPRLRELPSAPQSVDVSIPRMRVATP